MMQPQEQRPMWSRGWVWLLGGIALSVILTLAFNGRGFFLFLPFFFVPALFGRRRSRP